ncbi:MAG: hypothetical protein WAO88_14475, partial [Roseicyclus sp.]
DCYNVTLFAAAVEGRVPRTTVRGARSSVNDPTASGPKFEDRGPRFLELGTRNSELDQAEGWRRRTKAGEFATIQELAEAVGLAERHVSRQLRLAFLAPAVLKRLTCGRESSAVSLYDLGLLAGEAWGEQKERVL